MGHVSTPLARGFYRVFIGIVDGVTAPHEVTDWAKVRSIIRVCRRGVNVPGWVEVTAEGHGYEALSGSHRMAAVDLSNRLGRAISISPRVVTMTDEIRERLEAEDYSSLQDNYNE